MDEPPVIAVERVSAVVVVAVVAMVGGSNSDGVCVDAGGSGRCGGEEGVGTDADADAGGGNISCADVGGDDACDGCADCAGDCGDCCSCSCCCSGATVATAVGRAVTKDMCCCCCCC